MGELLTVFVSLFVLGFGIFSLLTGGFAAYFGSGRSRYVGVGIILFGIVALIIFSWFTGLLGISSLWNWNLRVVLVAFIGAIGALIGVIISLVIFLVAIMKV